MNRKGKKLTAIVPVERLEQMRRYARLHALAFLDSRRGGGLSEGEVGALADAARRHARRRGETRRTK